MPARRYRSGEAPIQTVRPWTLTVWPDLTTTGTLTGRAIR
jgi:hypothetical protein